MLRVSDDASSFLPNNVESEPTGLKMPSVRPQPIAMYATTTGARRRMARLMERLILFLGRSE